MFKLLLISVLSLFPRLYFMVLFVFSPVSYA
nr:MAG TPA: hypothetical protein [Caudoviricetes sp.]